MNQGIYGLAGQPIVLPASGGDGLGASNTVGVFGEYAPFFSGSSGQSIANGDVTNPGFYNPSMVVLRIAPPNNINNAADTQAPGLALEVPGRFGCFVVYSPNGAAASNLSGANLRGNPRGRAAIDIQTLRTSAASVASGVQSVAIGSSSTASGSNCISLGTSCASQNSVSIAIGSQSTAGSGTSASGIAIGNVAQASTGAFVLNSIAIGTQSQASGTTSVGIGNTAVASGSSGVAIGQTSTASGTSSVALGVSTTASNTSCVAVGNGSIASAAATAAFGGAAVSPTGISGSFTYNNNQTSTGTAGDSGHHRVLQRRTTTDAVGVQMFSNGPGTNTLRIGLANDTSMTFTVRIVARQSGGAAGTVGDTHCWTFTGGIKRSTASGTALVGAVGTLLDQSDAGAAAWTAVVSADAVNNALVVTVTGQVNKTVVWLADWEIARTSTSAL